ncbi:MAG: replicative DNA helicase [Eubacterium sp.]|mgnify:FL=1|nr:replicative DNA helicase [Clostridia bacterium]MCI8964276.1 replicative DNA helicase [Eubacterium sp.]MCI9412002.1 replicative DNA helicase [Eubacterium sp.]
MEEQMIKRILPHSTEAEQSVIGAMLLDQEAIITASEILVAEDFYNPQFKTLYHAMITLYQEGKPADLVTLQNKLKEQEVPAELCSVEFISGIISSVPTSANIKYYADIVKEKAVLRRLIRVSESITNECYQDTENLDQLLEQTEKQIFDVVQNRSTSDFVPIRQVALETLESIQNAAKTVGAVTGISTGFYDLDARTAGLQKSDLILIAARPSMGKTAFVLNIAETVAIKNNVSTAIFSLEMSRVQLAKRLISMNSKVDSQHIRVGNLADEEWGKLTESTILLGESPLVIDDTPGISIAQLRSKCRKLKLENNLGLVIIDYLQLMSGSGSRKNESRQQEISDISRSLKALAREIDCPVIALSQLSRAVESREDKRPMLSDLRESGAIEQDADVVMFIYRDEYYHKDSEEKGVTEIIIGKQRNGPTCTIKLKWLAEYTKFANLETN